MTRADPLVLSLGDGEPPLSLVGGKGASLARLKASGLPVPRGFHVTTEAYRRFVREGDLHGRVIAAASRVILDRPDTLEAEARHIHQLFADQAMPAEIADAIREAYASHGGPTVAVRSSATAEDLPGMSFAGQQDTYLNIRGDAALLDAVKRCWASLWTARAIDYRARRRIEPATVSLAVVVQELVAADAAGVLFTAHPVTGAREHVHINAAWGLGEAIVSGQVTPDTLVVHKTTAKVEEHRVSEKTVMTVRSDDGTRTEPVPAEKRRAAVLSEEEAVELTRLGVRIEDLYGQPMDVEWARAGGRLFLLQARPITTLETWNDSLASDSLWTNANVGEALPDVMTPCTWSLVQRFMADAMVAPTFAGHRLYGNIGGRLYLNLSVMATVASAFGMKRRLAGAVEQVFGRVPDGMEAPLLPVSRWRLLLDVVPLAFRVKREVRADQKKLAEFVQGSPDRAEALHESIRAARTCEELRELFRSSIEPYFRTASRMLRAAGRQDGSTLVTLRQELREQVGEADANALTTGLSAAGGGLESLGPLVGLAELERGAIDRATYDLYRSLPPLPTLIRGRFEPFRWAADPHRRGDIFDAGGAPPPARDVITGFPGAAGVVEATVRVLATPEEGDALQTGEVVVTTATNIGWTPLFPRASAIVTDVGAPLSHAAIVARELGIPAVVGCGDATTRLRTGDRVRVDGERGTVELLQGDSG